jgi:hypothetical protein
MTSPLLLIHDSGELEWIVGVLDFFGRGRPQSEQLCAFIEESGERVIYFGHDHNVLKLRDCQAEY